MGELRGKLFDALGVPKIVVDDSIDALSYGLGAYHEPAKLEAIYADTDAVTVGLLKDDTTSYVTSTWDSIDSGVKVDDLYSKIKELQEQVEELKKKEE